ncbi:MAG TPA: hypothetical protein VM658_14025 [bacterium]|nr:hypothetical protein [bacterium]
MSKSWEASKGVSLPDGKPAVGPYVGRIIEALSELIIPDGGRLPISVSESTSYEFLAKYLRDQYPGSRLGLKALLVVFDLAPLLFIGRFSRFVNLPPQGKELYLEDWCSSRIYYRRMVVVLLKTIIGMGYYNDPQVLEAIGFKLPCREGAAK